MAVAADIDCVRYSRPDCSMLAPKFKSLQKKGPDNLRGNDVVIIGMGRWGRILRSELQKQPSKVYAVARSNYDELLAQDGFNTQNLVAYSPENFDALLAKPDIGTVVIATSYPTHYEHALRALRAGKDVMIEKPAVETAAQLRELQYIAHERGLTLTVGYEYLFDKNVGEFALELSQGLVGEVQSIEINMLNPSGRFDPTANVVEDLCAHPLSMLHLLLGGGAGFEVGRCRLSGEAAEINLIYGGVPVRINLSRAAANRNRTIIVNGSEYNTELDYFAGQLSMSDTNGTAIEKEDVRFPAAFRNGPIEGPGTLAAEFNEFLNAVRLGAVPRNSVDHVFWITPCLEQIYSRFENITAVTNEEITAAS